MATTRAMRAALPEQDLLYTRPYLYPKQLAAIFDERRYSFIEASTKAGKTAGCIVWMVEQALKGLDGWNYWWVAPVTSQAEIAFTRMLRAIPHDLRTGYTSPMRIVLVGGQIIWFKSADKPNSLYGEDVYAAVLDEASRTKEEAFYALRSTLTATRGPLRCIGNVKGRRNWFYQLARRAEAGDPDMGYHKITARDAVAAHVLEESEVEDARKVLPDAVFRELYLAEPSDDQGNPFGLSAIAKCIEPIALTEPHVWGWDLAKSQDWTVGIALDEHGRTCRYERWQHVPWPETMDRIIRMTGHHPALVDSTGLGDVVLEQLQKAPRSNFEGYKFSAASKQKLMEGLAVAIQSQTVRFPGDPSRPTDDQTIRIELEQFEFTYARTGVFYSAPPGFHDDCVMALALAVVHRTHERTPMRISPETLARAAMGSRRR